MICSQWRETTLASREKSQLFLHHESWLLDLAGATSMTVMLSGGVVTFPDTDDP